MNLPAPLWAHWEVPPTIAAGLVGLLGAYLLGLGPWRPEEARTERVPRRQVAAFLGGLLTLFVTLTGPLDDVADHFLFSAHMIQHLLLMLVIAPLLLAGTPSWLLRPLLRPVSLARLARFLTRPGIAFSAFNGVLIVWHLPVFYNWAMENETAHIVMHLCFNRGGNPGMVAPDRVARRPAAALPGGAVALRRIDQRADDGGLGLRGVVGDGALSRLCGGAAALGNVPARRSGARGGDYVGACAMGLHHSAHRGVSALGACRSGHGRRTALTPRAVEAVGWREPWCSYPPRRSAS